MRQCQGARARTAHLRAAPARTPSPQTPPRASSDRHLARARGRCGAAASRRRATRARARAVPPPRRFSLAISVVSFPPGARARARQTTSKTKGRASIHRPSSPPAPKPSTRPRGARRSHISFKPSSRLAHQFDWGAAAGGRGAAQGSSRWAAFEVMRMHLSVQRFGMALECRHMQVSSSVWRPSRCMAWPGGVLEDLKCSLGWAVRMSAPMFDLLGHHVHAHRGMR